MFMTNDAPTSGEPVAKPSRHPAARLSPLVRRQLEGLDAVDYVDGCDRIHYAAAFAVHAVEEYRRGKGPKRIFAEAGFPVKAMGYKRIERAMQRWRHDYDTPVA